MIDVGIIGASGYTGQSLLEILLRHPGVRVKAITSDSLAGKTLSEVFPKLSGLDPLVFEKSDADITTRNIGAVFLCLPHTEAMAVAPKFLAANIKVFDLSADFRLRDAAVYEQWYKAKHSAPEPMAGAVYGLPELYREKIATASLVAVPGCYPTSAILGLAPVMGEDWLDHESIVINSASGVSGAGKKAETQYMLAELYGDFYAYGAPSHRHTPEIEQELSVMAQTRVRVTFIPHLLPVERGIYTTITAKMKDPAGAGRLAREYKDYYEGERFVTVHDSFPKMKWAVGTNRIHISATADGRTGTLIVTSAIDNLVKGASGQAVQCFNIRHGLDEAEGLR
ncbi:MAG: N-acetyl-gamma-glutamyl-phosphate reductase [Nitrospinae bacterium]|nr:N-acetyl-gamma-glutamyl-phosphate reductase [Nitrospinota bacterium]